MKKLLPILIVSLLSLVFLSSCGYTKPLVAADEYEINKDLLGIWLPPKEERKEGEELKIYKFSNTEYIIIVGPKTVFRGYEIEFKEKKYLQVEKLFPFYLEEEKEVEEEVEVEEEANENDLVCLDPNTDVEEECFHIDFNKLPDNYDFKKQRFQIMKYNLSGNKLIWKMLIDIEDVDSPANDINREGEDFFDGPEGYLERCSEDSDDCDYDNYFSNI